MCIYYTDRNDLTYGSGEHIIPAGLGGIKKLPDDVVSMEFNKDISVLETWFLRDSIINAVRQVVGPGSRGKMGPKHESKSKVHLLEDLPGAGELAVGYIKKGKPRLITYFSFDSISQALNYGMENTPGLDVARAIESLAMVLDKPLELKIKTIIDNRLSASIVYLGHQKGIDSKFDTFYFKNAENTMEAVDLPYVLLAHSFRNSQGAQQAKESKVKSSQTLNWKEDYLRVFAKVCFNFLADIKGKAYALQPCFDPIRKWIAAGGANHFAQLLKVDMELLKEMDIAWPDYAHIVLLIPEGGKLYGVCSFYKSYTVQVVLTDNLPAHFSMDGLICDWRARKEYRFAQYVLQNALKKVQ